MAQKTLLNECLSCKMKFDSQDQLANHVKKFCVGSDYGTQEKLEQKYQRELKNKYKSPTSDIVQEYNNQQIKPSQLDEEKYQREIRAQQRLVDQEYLDELDKLKQERKILRMQKQDDEKAYQDLLFELEQRKDKEIRARIEKDQIRRALVELEKTKLNTLEQEKKKELERLIQEREELRIKENELMREIKDVESNTQLLDQMRQEEMNRLNQVIGGIKIKQEQNNTTNQQFTMERAEKIAALKLKREQLEGERQRIMLDLDKVRKGEIIKQRNGQINLVSNAKNILNDMRDLQKLPFDPDEAYQNRATALDYATGEYQDRFQKLNQTTDIQKLDGFRQTLDQQPIDNDQTVIQQLERSQMRSRRGYSLVTNQQIPVQQQIYINTQKQQNIPQRLTQGAQQDIQNQIIIQGNQQSQKKQGQQYTQQNINNYGQQNSNQQVLMNYQGDLGEQQIVSLQQNQLFNAWGVPVPQFKNNNFQMVQPTQVPQQQRQDLSTAATLQSQAINQDPWELFSRKKEFFLQNEVRGVDLSEEERTLISLNAQEVDAMRVLSRLPIDSELYRFKMEQFKELSTLRAEIEKIVQEQRLQDAKMDFQSEIQEQDRIYNNEIWVDNHRKKIIDARLGREYNNRMAETLYLKNNYLPNTGFIIAWDYLIGLPRRTNYAQIVWGVYNGQIALQSVRLVEPRETEPYQASNRCIFSEQQYVYDTPAETDSRIIIEAQLPYSKRVQDNVGRTETFGWTQLDLFDINRQLLRGRFKCPLYYGPTDPTITKEEIQNLEPIPGCYLYLRIAIPNDRELLRLKSLAPEQNLYEYEVPILHLRGIYGKREPNDLNYTVQQGGKQYKMIEETIEESQYPNVTNIPQVQQEEQQLNQTVEIPLPQQQLQQTNDSIKQRKGLKVIIHKVINHQARSHMRVQCAILEDGNLVLDDTGRPIAFNTTVHNPLDLRPENKIELPEGFIQTLPNSNPEYFGMNNKSKGGDVIFQEEYKSFRNLTAMWNKNKKDLWLGLQVVEKPEPIQLQGNDISGSINYGGLEFELQGWQFLKISGLDGKILNGNFKLKLFKQPLRRPPIDRLKVQETGITIDISLQDFVYDNSDIEEYKKQQLKKPQKQVRPKSGLDDVQLDNSPFIERIQQQWINKQFEKRMGIDFYIDGVRFLPDKVTVCKIIMEVFTMNYETVLEADSTLPDLNSMAYNPEFNYRRELRKDSFDPTSLVLLTIFTIDKSLNENRKVGYAAINLFINPLSKQQPLNANEQEFVLFNGSYQIPVFSQQIDRTPPFTIDKIYTHERSPCCSVLVRINQAPLSDDGKRPLSIVDFPEKSKQREKGIVLSKKKYGQGVYNTTLYKVLESEKELFKHRTMRSDVTVREAANLLVQGRNINKELKDAELLGLIDQWLLFSRDTMMIDMMYFAKYRPQAGFRFIVDGLHNVKIKDHAYAVIYSLSVPGTFYVEPRDLTQGHLTSTYDFNSKINTPQFTDDWFVFKENVNRYLCMVMDIKSVPFKNPNSTVIDVGWTILPIFSTDGYVMSGIYQIPLFRGPVPQFIIQDLKDKDAWDYLKTQVKIKKIFYQEYTSIVCRLVDSQSEGHYAKRFDMSRKFEYKFLPQENIRNWSYTQAEETKQNTMDKLSKYLPNKDKPQQFNQKITDYFKNQYGLK